MRRVPDFFIVGQPKTGTSALHAMLRHHPQIYMPDFKEPNYFARELASEPSPDDLPTTLGDYLSLFAAAEPDQLTGEASVLYLWSRTAAHEIARLRPDARIIVILREPASFLRSLHLQLINSRVENKHDLRSALALEEARRGGRHLPRGGYRPCLLLYSEHMRYMEQLRRYHDVFPAHRLLVLLYDDYLRDNSATVRKILRFLGVDDTVALCTMDVNESHRIRTRYVKDMVDAVSGGRSRGAGMSKAVIEAVTPQPLRRAVRKAISDHIVYAKPPGPDQDLMLELRRRYKPEVQALSEWLGLDLVTLWGYHDVES
jgi:hypothetical protein